MPVDETQYSRVRIPLAETAQLKALATINERPYGGEVMRGIKAHIAANLPAIEKYLENQRKLCKSGARMPRREK